MTEQAHGTTMPSLPPFNISTALLASELPPADANGEAARWIKVTPRGHAQTRDGRRYSFTPETLVARFQADGIDLAADLNHAIALKGAKGEDAGAIGWAKEVQARADGTYARIDWLPSGSAILAARSHRYVSPTFHHDDSGEATWLHSISLVPAPAMPMPALAAADVGRTGAAPTTIAEALGLDPTADEAACLAAIGALNAEFVPIGLFTDAVATLNAANTSLASHRGAARTTRVAGMLESALSAGKLLPYERPHYEALCSTDAGLERVGLLLANKLPHGLFQSSGLDGRQPDAGEADLPETLAAKASRYRNDQARAGRTITHAEATRFVHANPTAAR